MARATSTKGFTLIELAIVICVVAILAAGAVMRFADLKEDRDAQAVRAVQATMQSVVTQGSVRADVPPSVVLSNATQAGNATRAMRRLMMSNGAGTVHSGITITALSAAGTRVTVPSTGRFATLNLNPVTNNIDVIGLSPSWTKHTVTNGQICRIGATGC